MKITFVRPVFNREDTRPVVDIPLGLLSLATILAEAGHLVRIVDLQLLFLQGRLGPDADHAEEAARLITADGPELIGFTALCNSYPAAILIARACRDCLPAVPIIFGGPQATFVDVETLHEFPWIDAIVRGEGEGVILPLVEAIERGRELAGIAGVTYRTPEGEILRNADQEYIADLDTLPEPEYTLLAELDEYFRPGASISLDVGRGCPYHCRYCSTSLLWRRQFRIKSPERIVREIAQLHQHYGVQTVKLTHDLFTVKKDVALEFCRLLSERCPEVTWACSARTSTMDDELLQAFAASGCQMIFYGIESGSPKTLQYYRKELDLAQAQAVIRATLARKIKAMTSFIVGAPVEDESDLNQTLTLGLQCKVMGAHTAQMHLLVPESGTDLYQENRDRLLLGADFSADNARLVNPHSHAEIELIRRYPHIFSTFYTVQNDQVAPGLLYAIERRYSRALNMYPRTMYLLLQETALQPLDLCRAWTEWGSSGENAETPTSTSTSEEALESFAAFIKAGLDAGRWPLPYLHDLLRYEKTFATFSEREYFTDRSPCPDPVTDAMVLRLSDDCSVGHYHYDIPLLIEELKDLHYTPPGAKEVYLIFRYLGSNYVKSVVTNEFTYDILHHCEQPRTAAELKSHFLAKWRDCGPSVEAEFDQALQYLVRQRFIADQTLSANREE